MKSSDAGQFIKYKTLNYAVKKLVGRPRFLSFLPFLKKILHLFLLQIRTYDVE